MKFLSSHANFTVRVRATEKGIINGTAYTKPSLIALFKPYELNNRLGIFDTSEIKNQEDREAYENELKLKVSETKDSYPEITILEEKDNECNDNEGGGVKKVQSARK